MRNENLPSSNERAEDVARLSDREFFRRLADAEPVAGDDVVAAADPWDDPGWREAALDYHKKRGNRPGIVSYEPEEIARLRRLMDDKVSPERAWHDLNSRASGAAASTVEALVYGLRDGLAALEQNRDRLRRLSELSVEQLRDVCRRVQSFDPKIAIPWSADQAAVLIAKWEKLT